MEFCQNIHAYELMVLWTYVRVSFRIHLSSKETIYVCVVASGELCVLEGKENNGDVDICLILGLINVFITQRRFAFPFRYTVVWGVIILKYIE